jgi:hypothetical protein
MQGRLMCVNTKLALPAANPICYAGILIEATMNVIKSIERRIGIPCLTAAALLAGTVACSGETGQAIDSTTTPVATAPAPGITAPDQFHCRANGDWVRPQQSPDLNALLPPKGVDELTDLAAHTLKASKNRLLVGVAICEEPVPTATIKNLEAILPIRLMSDNCLLVGAAVVGTGNTQPPTEVSTPIGFCAVLSK